MRGLAIMISWVGCALVLSGCLDGADDPLISPDVAAVAARDLPQAGPGQAPSPADPIKLLTLDPERFERRDEGMIQRLDDGSVAQLTLDPVLQEAVVDYLMRAGKEVPYGAVVALEPATGRVRAMVSVGRDTPNVTDLALRAAAPSASVFKWVTATALLDAGVSPDQKVCYSGGHRHLDAELITGPPGDDRCAALDAALAESLNVVISRLAYGNLSRKDLELTALRFGFNQHIPFELPVTPSTAVFSEDSVERARTAAGFWNVDISPLHGAMIAAAFANDGVMMQPTLVERVERPDGTVVEMQPLPLATITTPERARLLGKLAMGSTRGKGTASKAFHDRPDWPEGFDVTGKTGTLSNKQPFYAFTWFVGYAPLETPELAVAGLVANEPKWWIKGMHGVAKTLLSHRSLSARRKKIRDAAAAITD